MSSTICLGTEYELNKQLVLQQEPMTQEAFNKQKASIGAWFSSDMHKRYYMLLCKERSDYTIFHFNDNSENYVEALEELIDILEMRGEIMRISYVHSQNAYEIWVRTREEEPEVFMFMLFDCDDFIIHI